MRWEVCGTRWCVVRLECASRYRIRKPSTAPQTRSVSPPTRSRRRRSARAAGSPRARSREGLPMLGHGQVRGFQRAERGGGGGDHPTSRFANPRACQPDQPDEQAGRARNRERVHDRERTFRGAGRFLACAHLRAPPDDRRRGRRGLGTRGHRIRKQRRRHVDHLGARRAFADVPRQRRINLIGPASGSRPLPTHRPRIHRPSASQSSP